jgi:predicted enzyme related to lactoylglutathione lyase
LISFARFELRTTDVPAARSFYEALGFDFDGVSFAVTELSARAVAAGAPSHWLGQFGVEDVEVARARWLARGASMLGPDVVKDPFGARFGFTRGGVSSPKCVSADLYVTEPMRAASLYSELNGWTFASPVPLGGEFGARMPFEHGGILDISQRPQVHPQWQFTFAVGPSALDVVRSRGGEVLATVQGRTSIHDPQGASLTLLRLA